MQFKIIFQVVVALSVSQCWVIFHRPQNPKVCGRSPSPCFRRPSLLCSTRWASTLAPRPAETQPNEAHQTWSNCRQSWETWGTSLIRWRVSTSMASLWLKLITVQILVFIAVVALSQWGVFTALMWQLSCVPARKLNCWWMSLMRRNGFVWLYRCDLKKKKQTLKKLLFHRHNF